MTTSQQQELGKTLWGIANNLRGAMMADDFRDYMLSFLFWKYLSDSYVNAAKKELGQDYPDSPQDNTLGSIIPLQKWYDDNPKDIILFEKQMKRKVHYVVEPKYLWDNIVELSRIQSTELLQTLEEGFKYIENDSFDSSFKGLFSEINLSSEKLGKNYTERNELLTKVITTIANGLKEFSADNDSLGDAYEYLIGQFAAGSGKKAGEFYTPQAVSELITRIVTKGKEGEPAFSIYDKIIAELIQGYSV
jgi:type I restriction enzyme M protein